jgi:hypothetical protein
MTEPSDHLGPVEYLVLILPPTPSSGGFDALLELVDTGQIRVLDLEIVRREDDGALVLATTSWGQELGLDLTALDGATSGLLDDEDRDILVGRLGPGQTALVLVYEVLVLERVVAAFEADGAVVLDEGPVADDDLVAAANATAPGGA